MDKEFVRVINSSGTFDTVYYYDGNTLVDRKDVWTGQKFFYHPDHLGSTTLVTNEAGKVVEEITYESFGQVFSGDTERFGHIGK